MRVGINTINPGIFDKSTSQNISSKRPLHSIYRQLPRMRIQNLQDIDRKNNHEVFQYNPTTDLLSYTIAKLHRKRGFRTLSSFFDSSFFGGKQLTTFKIEAVNYSRKKVPLLMFDMVVNTFPRGVNDIFLRLNFYYSLF